MSSPESTREREEQIKKIQETAQAYFGDVRVEFAGEDEEEVMYVIDEAIDESILTVRFRGRDLLLVADKLLGAFSSYDVFDRSAHCGPPRS